MHVGRERLAREAVAPLLERLPHRSPLLGLRSAASVSTAVADRLWESTAGESGLGLAISLARTVGASSFGLLTRLIAASATVGEGLRQLARYYGVLSTGAEFGFESSATRVALTCRVHGETSSVGREVFATLATLGFLRAEAVAPVLARAVSLKVASPSPDLRRRCAELCGIAVEFSAAHDRIVFDQEAMTCPLRAADPVLAALLATHAQAHVGDRTPWSQRVLEVIVQAERSCDDDGVEHVANALATRPRTLRRRLALEGTGYRELVDRVRRDRAEALLAAGEPIHEVTSKLGFSEPRAFRRAFARWHGTSPAAFRAALKRRGPLRSA